MTPPMRQRLLFHPQAAFRGGKVPVTAISRLKEGAWLAQTGRRLAGYAPAVLPYIFAVLLAWALPPLLWRTILSDLPSTSFREGGVPSGRAVRSSVSILEAQNPFGHAPSALSGAGSSQPVVASSLSLILLGVAVTPNPRDSLALLGTANGPEHVYHPGDILPGGARLVAVRHNRVLIRYQGVLQSVAFRHHSLSVGGLPTAGSGYPGPVPPSFASRLLSHPSNLLNYLRPMPVYANGRFAGIRLYPGPNASLFDRVGLRPGDILTAVNGVPLTNPLQGYNLIQRFASRHMPIVLNIERNGATLVISLPTASAF